MQYGLLDRDLCIGPVRLTSVSCIDPSSPIGILHVEHGGHAMAAGLRIDLDKQRVFDSLGDPDLDHGIQAMIPEVCALVQAYRSG